MKANARGRTGHLLGTALRVLLVGMALVPAGTQAQSAASKEYQIKAAFLFNFVQFVEWPVTAFANGDSPICIGVLGENPFGTALDETVRGEVIGNRKVVVQRSREVEDLKDCHLVFVSKSEAPRIPAILAELDARAVLTVSEIEGFARRGGIVNLYLVGNKVRFEINPAAARRKGLKISSELLSVGKLVEAEPGGGDL